MLIDSQFRWENAMSGIILYKSKYGTTKRYAAWIAAALDADLFDVKDISTAKINEYDYVVLGGGMYAGSVLGANLINKIKCKQIVIFTVGLADPATTDYSEHIKKMFPDGVPENVKIFHFRGGINYNKLSLVHKTMMSMLVKTVQKKTDLSEEEKLFASSYGSEIDFCDEKAISPLVEYIKGLL
jgi:menaquinone-dependent protoporphyrinogen IX oxidase